MADTDPLDQRLAVLAAELALPGLPIEPYRAVALAVDLVAADRATAATVDVASLPAGSSLRDTEVPIRAMLAEQGLVVPEPGQSEEEQYAIARWAFGMGGLSVAEFSRWTYGQIPAWVDQDETEREIVRLLDAWDHESDPSARSLIETSLRTAAART